MTVSTIWAQIVSAADANAGLAGWAQAVGTTGAIVAAILIANGQERVARRARVEAQNALIDLCIGLGERGRESTRKARDILLAMPPPEPPLHLAFQAPVKQWETEMGEVWTALTAVPRDEVRDPTLAFYLGQLLRATDVSLAMGYAMAHLETARITLNSQEILIGAALEGVHSRRLRR